MYTLTSIRAPNQNPPPSSMSISGIQGQPLEVTVVGCTKLKDTEWISRQDPYVCIEYGSTKFRTRTCTDGGKNPSFQEKFVLTLIEGLREINVVVWNSNTLTYDDFIGSGKILLQKVLSNGYDDSSWSLQDKKGRHAGEIKLILHYSTANKPPKTPALAPSAPPYPVPAPQAPHYPVHVPPYPPKSIPEPAPNYQSYPPVGYPPPPYHQPATYPPMYPPGPSPSIYPPPPHHPHHHPPGLYPPPPYPPPPY